MHPDDAHPPHRPTVGVRCHCFPKPPALWLLLFLLAAVTGCGGSAVSETASAGGAPSAGVEAAEPSPAPTVAGRATRVFATPSGPEKPEPTPHPLALADTQLPTAPIGFEGLVDESPVGPQPTSMRIDSLGIGGAAIIPVGVNPDQTFEVPPADLVGWYRFGPRPGDEGSAVLAAHIAYDGVDGVFRDLSEVETGSIVEVGFDDGSVQRYRVTQVVEYLKDELPESLFARTGSPQVALITCGGSFNPQLRSYESNTVAIAVPV